MINELDLKVKPASLTWKGQNRFVTQPSGVRPQSCREAATAKSIVSGDAHVTRLTSAARRRLT